MPVRNKKSQVAKQKKRAPGRTTFTHRADTPRQETTDYFPLDNDSDGSTTDTGRRNDRERDDPGLGGLQSLYSVFLPPHMQPKEITREKRQKIQNRPAVYTRDSRTTGWRRDTAQRQAAEGCAKLDTFITRKVYSSRVFESHNVHSFLSQSEAPT
jgi:hypothetical protein